MSDRNGLTPDQKRAIAAGATVLTVMFPGLAVAAASTAATGGGIYALGRYVVAPSIRWFSRRLAEHRHRPEPDPPEPSREEILQQALEDAKREYDLQSRLIHDAGLDEFTKSVVLEHAKQQYVRRLRDMMSEDSE